MIASLARAHPDDIDKAYDALKARRPLRIHVFMSTSAIHMEKMLRLTPDEVMKASVEGVRRAAATPTMSSSRPRTPPAPTPTS